MKLSVYKKYIEAYNFYFEKYNLAFYKLNRLQKKNAIITTIASNLLLKYAYDNFIKSLIETSEKYEYFTKTFSKIDSFLLKYPNLIDFLYKYRKWINIWSFAGILYVILLICASYFYVTSNA